MFRYTLVVAAVYAMCCALALGQTSPGQGGAGAGGAGAGGGAGAARSTPPGLTKSAPPVDLNALMDANGGSLLGATNAAAANAVASGVSADPRKMNLHSLFAVAPAQPHLFKKHDLVTLIVNETSETQTAGTTALTKQADIDSKVDSYIKMNLAKLAIQGGTTPTVAPELKMENSQDFTGTGSVKNNDEAQTRVTCEILDVKPNGTLVLQARRHMKSDDEIIDLLVTGTCRADDVMPDNTVLSNQCYDLQFQRITKGVVRDTNKRGLFTKILDFVNPF